MYEVGNFIYFSSNKTKQIFSGRIVEEITIKKLSGTETDYRVDLKNSLDSQFLLSELRDVKKFNIFDNINELKQFMLKNVENTIDKLISKCQEDKTKYWGKTKDQVLEEIADQNTDAINSNKQQVELEDGTKVNIIDNAGVLSNSNG